MSDDKINLTGNAKAFADGLQELFSANATTAALESSNLPDATQRFMQLAGQLEDEPVLSTDHSMGPSHWNDTDRKLRLDLIAEEYAEYTDAEFVNNHVEILDGLLDIIVIAWGTALKYFGPEKAKAAAAEVARSNLSKVDGTLGPIQLRSDGKILKPEGWTPPDIEGVLNDSA